jgi:hypothetical protein
VDSKRGSGIVSSTCTYLLLLGVHRQISLLLHEVSLLLTLLLDSEKEKKKICKVTKFQNRKFEVIPTIVRLQRRITSNLVCFEPKILSSAL